MTDNSTPSQRQVVSELRELLGLDVLLLGWPLGRKWTKKKWGHLTVADMTPKYLAKLEHGNIGVVLGEKSGDLIAIDLDDDDKVEPFLKVNPTLKDTLQTHGARGRVFWVRMVGKYPCITRKLKNATSGMECGEWRAGKNTQSIIHGVHPVTGNAYQIVNHAKPMVVEFSSIVWPKEIVNPFKGGDCTEETEEQRRQRHRSPEEPKSSSCAPAPRFHSTINSIEDALRITMPTKKRENNALLFKLARAIKTLELKGQEFELRKLAVVFDLWYKQAEPFLREGQGKEEYYFEFLNACERAKFPLGSVKVAEAWANAKSQPLPAEAMRFKSPEMRLLVALLKQLQVIQGVDPFFITYRDCAALLGHKSHTTAATWLGALAKMKYILVVEPGNEGRATRYRYIWKEDIA